MESEAWPRPGNKFVFYIAIRSNQFNGALSAGSILVAPECSNHRYAVKRIGPKSNMRLRVIPSLCACAEIRRCLLATLKLHQTSSHEYETHHAVPRFERHLRCTSFIDSRASRHRCSRGGSGHGSGRQARQTIGESHFIADQRALSSERRLWLWTVA